jgi:ElaB/YqjD/DUF883 family membrane-anchored ribosome-binding protein
MPESKHAATYPTQQQYIRWKNRADELGMSTSEFIEAMVEAGMKKFDASANPDETNRELRQQRNKLKNELDRARERIQELEDAVYHGERRTIKEYVRANPGAEYDEIIRHVMQTVPERVTTHLDDMEGEDLLFDDDRYYPTNSGSEQ